MSNGPLDENITPENFYAVYSFINKKHELSDRDIVEMEEMEQFAALEKAGGNPLFAQAIERSNAEQDAIYSARWKAERALDPQKAAEDDKLFYQAMRELGLNPEDENPRNS